MQMDAIYQGTFEKLKQQVHQSGMDLGQLRKVWSEDKLRQLDEIIDDMGQLKYEMTVFNAQFKELALAEDLEKLKGIVTCDYVLKDSFDNLEKEVEYKASSADVQKLADSSKKHAEELEKHRAMLRKLEDFRDETSEDLKERPDASKFADIIAGIRLQIRDTDDRLRESIENGKAMHDEH